MHCRLCLFGCNEENVVEIFSNEENTSLSIDLTKYMDLEITPCDSISTKICKSCLQHLNDFKTFYLFIKQRQNELKNEFLEIKCIVSKNNEVFQTIEHNEESMLDIEDIISEYSCVDPHDEFSFAGNMTDRIDHEIIDTTQEYQNKNILNDELTKKTVKELRTGFRDHPYKKVMESPNIYIQSNEKKYILNEDFLKKTLVECNDTKVTLNRKYNKEPKTSNNNKCKIKPKKNHNSQTTETNKSANNNKKLIKLIKNKNDDGDYNKRDKIAIYAKQHKKSYRKEDILSDKVIAQHVQLKCEICDASAENFGNLRIHFQNEHKSMPYVICCGNIFRRRSTLFDHINVHINPNYFKCNICHKLMKSRRCFDVHMIVNHSDEENQKYLCEFCDRRFAYIGSLHAHMISHSDERNYLCELCNKGFKTIYLLKNHIRSMHEQSTSYVCDTCGKEYKFKPSFDKHVAEHQGKFVETTAQCKICAKWFTPLGLRRHMVRHNIENVECPECGKIIKSKSALRSHIEYSHGKVLFSCTYCDKTFKRSCVLKEHIAMHIGRKDYKCPHCSRDFRSKANMYAHIKKIHTEEWLQNQITRNQGPVHLNEKQHKTAYN